MSAGPTPLAQPSPADARLAQLEDRLARLEAFVGLTASSGSARPQVIAGPAPPEARTRGAVRREDELEFELGQNWFARVGIVALVAGGGFMLTQPFPGVPASVPPLAGLAVAVLFFILAHLSARSFEVVSSCLRGAGMALLFLATLRLFFFTPEPALNVHHAGARLLLALVVGVNLAIGWRRGSPWLIILALATGYASAFAAGSAWITLSGVTLLSALAIVLSQQRGWARLPLVVMLLTYGTYLAWAVLARETARPLLAAEPPLAPAVLLLNVLVLAVAPLAGPGRRQETPLWAASALINCILGYGIFLVHTLTAFAPHLATAHLAAFVLFLGIAVLFSLRSESRVVPFLYAMTGYAALSIAILKLARTPDVFVWLSLQSLVVLASAIWFRSRFIVVANFFIFAGTVLAYLVLHERETGISLGFGVVALVSARILNWKKHRLELETELMRNVYLLSALVVFPYALYHLVPGKFVALAWVGLALAYYVMNLLVRNQKYRWMGHLTLLAATLYVALIGTSQLGPTMRVLSFLALGVVFVVVSLTFTRLRGRRPTKTA